MNFLRISLISFVKELVKIHNNAAIRVVKDFFGQNEYCDATPVL